MTNKLSPINIETIIKGQIKKTSVPDIDDKKKHQILLPTMSERQPNDSQIASASGVKRYFKKKRETPILNPQNCISSSIIISAIKPEDALNKKTTTPSLIARPTTLTTLPTAPKQDRMNEQALLYPANSVKPVHSTRLMEQFPMTGIPEAEISANVDRPLSNIGAMQLPLFDKLFLYQMCKGKNIMASTTTRQFRVTQQSSPCFSVGGSRKLRRRVLLRHMPSADNRDTFFMFTSTLSYKNKSQENRYKTAQRDLHVLRNILCACKKREDELKTTQNVYM